MLNSVVSNYLKFIQKSMNMSYLETRVTRTEFIKTIEVFRTQANMKSYHRLDYFYKDLHQKDTDQVILDIQETIN